MTALVRYDPHRYGIAWTSYLRPRFVWNECYRGVEWAAWFVGWTNPVYKRLGW